MKEIIIISLLGIAVLAADVLKPRRAIFLLIMFGLYQYSPALTVVAGLAVVLGAVYMLCAFQSMMLGAGNHNTINFAPLTRHEKTVLGSIVALHILLGVCPSLVLELSNASVERLLSGVH